MKTRLLFLAVLAAFLLAGCAAHKRPGESFIGEVPGEAVPAIARDAAKRLAELYPPGRTAIHVAQTQNRDQTFFVEFENALRAHGFRIQTGPGNGPGVAWTIDVLGRDDIEPSVYALFRIQDRNGRKTISRVYDRQGNAKSAFALGITE